MGKLNQDFREFIGLPGNEGALFDSSAKEMSTTTNAPDIWPLTVISLGILLVFYPMTIAPTGPLSNGGILGLGSLILAATFAWAAFIRQRSMSLLRWLVNMPIAAMVTWTAIWDGLAQYHSGFWRGF